MKRSVPLRISEPSQPLPGGHRVDTGTPPSPRSGLFTPSNLALFADAGEQLIGPRPTSTPLIDAETFRQKLLQMYPSEDPIVLAMMAVVAKAFEQWEEVQKMRLNFNGRDLFILEREARIKRPATAHLMGLLLTLKDALQRPAPPLHIAHAEQVQVAVIQSKPTKMSPPKKSPAKKSAKI